MNDETTSTATNRFDPRHSHDGDLTNRFTYHPPEPEQPEVYQLVRDVAHLLAIVVEAATHPSPERDRAVTRVEEAVMWANAGIARRGLRDAAYAGASDLYDHALHTLWAAKPHTAVLGSTDPASDPTDDPWPPDGHVTPVLEPEARGYEVTALRAGLGLLTESHSDDPGQCPACTAQMLLNGMGVHNEPAPTGTTDDDGAGTHPDHWSAVCPWCPTYICTEGRGAQRDAQEWLMDHAEQAHGKTLRS